jgi:flagellar FliJ protein
MKSRDTLIRLKRFQAEEKRRRVIQLQAMIADFSRMCAELDREIATEEARANNNDPSHFAYPTYARAARVRRDNLSQSLAELRGQLEEAENFLKEANDELAKAQTQESRDRGSDRMIDIVAERRTPEAGEIFRRA